MDHSVGDAIESSGLISNSPISGILKRLIIMAKKPTIESDISQVLDEFLGKLNEYNKYLEHGIFNINFAEAALLLQSCTDIYSKKVDILWDIIFDYQKHMLLNDQQNAEKDKEIQKLEERKRKYKRKRKTKETEQQTSQLINNFSFGATEYVDYVNTTVESNDLIKEWEKINLPPPSNVDVCITSNKNSRFLPTTKIHTEDGEYIGRYNQFHSAAIIEDMFQTRREPEKEINHIIRTTTTESCVSRDSLLEKSISVNVPAELIELTQSKNNSTPQQKTNSFRESYVCLERLPLTLVQEKLRRMSFADSLFDDDSFSSISESCSIMRECCDEGEYDPVSGAIEKRNKSCSQDSAFYELEDDEHWIDTPLPDTSITKKELCCGGAIIIPKPRMVKRKLITTALTEEKLKKRKVAKRRISEKKLKKLATGITASFKDFEKFCRMQYKPAEHEGLVPLPESDTSSDEEASDGEEIHQESDHDDPSVEPFPQPETNEPALNQPSFTQCDQSRKTVREWRDFIVPKLKSLENKSDFDIHEYGSKIMEGSEVGEERGFASIVQGKGSAEVARYFLATLQLATTSNVAIVGAVPGKVANDSFKVKTLDKTKYHELLDEYQAPSEETFRERLERAQAMNPKVKLHSTPCSPTKKIRLGNYSRKKLF